MASAVIPFPVARRDVPESPPWRVAQAKAEGEVTHIGTASEHTPMSMEAFFFSLIDALLYTAPQRQKERIAGVLFNEMARQPENTSLVSAYNLAWRYKRGLA